MAKAKTKQEQNVAKWKAAFEEINRHCLKANGGYRESFTPLAPENAEYYAEQIWNMTGEGEEMSEQECLDLAKAICR
jgi:hypothetical protein